MERRKKIAVELSDLVVYCRPVPFNEDSKDQAALTFFFFFKVFDGVFCCFQRSGRSEPVTGTCRRSPRPRRRSLRPAAKGSASCSTTSGSFPGFTLEDRGWTRPTMTLFPCGSAAPSWSHSTFRLQVSVDEDTNGTLALHLKQRGAN